MTPPSQPQQSEDDRVTPLDLDVAYWRQQFEERIALEEEGFATLLADRDRYRDALRAICREKPDHISARHREAQRIAAEALARTGTEPSC